MRRFILSRCLISVVILLGISFFVYILIRSMPGDYIDSITAGNPKVTPEMVIRLKTLYGLNEGSVEGYFSWLSEAFRGNFGDSFVYGKPVTEVIGSHIGISFWIAFIAFSLQLIIAIPLGVLSAVKQYSKMDSIISATAMIGISMPTFFFAAILQRIFAVELDVLPLQGMVTARYDYHGLQLFMDIAKHMILPITVFVVSGVGGLIRFTRMNMLEVLETNYIRTARGKGLKESQVIIKHGARNALNPIITWVGASIPGLFSGAIVIEGIFGIDGLGTVALNATKQGDIPFMMAFNLLLAFMTLLGSMLADILYAVADPRIRL